MLDHLAGNPILLLFAVVAVGYPLGRLSIRGVGLGVAAILFAGLGVGALDPRLRLPEVVQQLGLVLFVYSIGLASGPGFFATLRRHGLRNAALAGLALAVTAVVVVAGSLLTGTAAEQAPGIFAGSVTNTPTLAGVLEMLAGLGAEGNDPRLAAPVIAYSVAYPVGVLAPIVAIALLARLWPDDDGQALRRSHEWPATAQAIAGSGGLVVATARVTTPGPAGGTIGAALEGITVQPGRVQRAGGGVLLATDETPLAAGDLVSLVGEQDQVATAIARLGEQSHDPIHLDRRELDARRIFVSNPKVAGRRLRDLDLPQHLGALVTAIRRGDTDWVPNGDTILQLGDRVRVLTRRDNLAAVSRFLGDSYRAVSEFDVLTFSFGIVLGIAVGLVPIPLPGGVRLELGLAGGPLVVAMVLGAVGRTGRFVWGIPYGASMTMRELGLVLFFAGIGTRSGRAVLDALGDPATLALLAVGAAASLLTAATVVALGRWLFRVPRGLLAGMIAGIFTGPAALTFAMEREGNETPAVGYAAVFPFATILKIVVAQVMYLLLR